MPYRVDKSLIAYLSQKYGPMILTREGVDPKALMWAIAGRESTFGYDCDPRHEPAYDVGGAYAGESEQASLLALYGRAAACSYGPWQVMLVNCAGFTPTDMANAENGAKAFVHHVNRFVIGARHAETVEQIAQAYNSGNFSHEPTGEVLDYVRTVRKYYDAYIAARSGATP